jgi:hypothetical protein
MKKFSSRTFPRSRLAFALAVAFALILSSIQGCHQSGGNGSDSANKGPSKEEILPNADKAYYYLQSRGLKSFRCTVQLNLKPSEVDQSKFAQLDKSRYAVVVDDQGSATVTPVRASGKPNDQGLDEVASDGRQLVEAFFQMWDSLVFTGMFTGSDDEKKMSPWEQPDGFHYSGSLADGSKEFVLTRDSLLTTMKMTSEGATILMQPKFAKTDGGLWLMTGMDTDKTVEDFPVNQEEKLSVQIQYQPVGGFQLPASVEDQITLSNGVVSIGMNFTDYHLTKQ